MASTARIRACGDMLGSDMTVCLVWNLMQPGSHGDSTGDGRDASPVPLFLAFPPSGPHFCSEELVEAVLLPAFTVRQVTLV